MKKLGAAILMVGALAVLVMLAIALYLQPAERRFVRGERVVELLKVYSWVKERVGIAELSFTLSGRDGYLELTLGAGPVVDRAAGDELFTFDPDRFIRAHSSSSFKEAQLKHYSTRVFDSDEARYRRQAPHLMSWGALPYPPVRTLPKSWKPDAPGSFARSFLADPAYHSRLDELTGSELTQNEEVKLYQNGTAFPMLERMVASARKFAFLNVLSMTCDPATEKFISTLESKARAKVDVRVLIHRWFARLDRACLERLKSAGVDIVKTETHASYLVTDQGEAAIGSESVARMFASSNGYNFLDRDLMLWVKGPLATDVLQDFISVWEANRDEVDPHSLELVNLYKNRKARELEAGVRGPNSYAGWLRRGEPRALCRFAAQKPKRRGTALTDLLVSLTQSAKKEVFASGVDIGESAALKALRDRAKQGVTADLLVNGFESGNGELTMVLDEWIGDLEYQDRSRTARALERLKDYDQRKLARKRYQDVRDLATGPGLQAWAYFGFLHYKAWAFDHYGVWIGSANPDTKAQEKLYEAGALCLDGRLAREFAETRALDLMNSVPYPTR